MVRSRDRNIDREDEVNNTYYVPANFTDSGRILQGMFEVRNAVEATLFGGVTGWLMWSVFDFEIKTRLMLVCLIALPIGAFALVGYHGDSMTRVMKNVYVFMMNRRKMRFRRIKVNGTQADADKKPGNGKSGSRARSR